MRKLALPISLLALGPLGLVACAGDDRSTVAAETEAAHGSPATPAKLYTEHNLARIASKWARLYARAPNPNACAGYDERHPNRDVAAKYMSQPACERSVCERPSGPIERCTPPSPGYQRSFRSATVKELAIDGGRAAVRFSNGEVVAFAGVSQNAYQLGPDWLVAKIGANAGHEFFVQALTPSGEEEIAKLGDEWAPLFAEDDLKACRYMRWVACKESYDYGDPLEPADGHPSGLQKSFVDATVERVVIEDPDADPVVAAAEFSNGELVELLPSVGRIGWLITNVGDDVGKERPSDAELITKRGNEWAPLFADGGYTPSACRYMGQPACERMGCERAVTGPIKNCTPPSAEFRESFADATVEWVLFEGHHATAQFSNGESVEFEGPGNWFITERWIKNVARRNFEP